MKIIALLPVKNESWVLPTYISSMKKIADEIIALDDDSEDNSVQILRDNNIQVLASLNNDKIINMSQKRMILLDEGRKRGGTHFIWLDADESFDTNFLKYGKKIIEDLLPGQKIKMRWITLWKSINKERVDGVWSRNFKDVIVCDKSDYNFEDKNLSEGRTQGPNQNYIELDDNVGVILHFQFIDFEVAQIKQAWYRCIEFIQNKINPRFINNIYSITEDSNRIKLVDIKKDWFENIIIPKISINRYAIYLNQIFKMFDKYGVQYFESLDVWYIKELKDVFIKKTRRNPKPKKFPCWLIKLNNIKNKIKNNKYINF